MYLIENYTAITQYITISLFIIFFYAVVYFVSLMHLEELHCYPSIALDYIHTVQHNLEIKNISASAE